MRISARRKAWPWSLLDEREWHIEIHTGLGDLLDDHDRGQIKPAHRRIEDPTIWGNDPCAAPRAQHLALVGDRQVVRALRDMLHKMALDGGKPAP